MINERGNDEKKRSNREATADASTRASSVIEDPAPGDIILGRGSAHSWRPSHCHLHKLVDYYQAMYHGSSNRKAKAKVVNVIYENLKGVGRFLRKIPGMDAYEEVPEKTAREKIAHTLRDRRQKSAPIGSPTRPASSSGAPFSPSPALKKPPISEGSPVAATSDNKSSDSSRDAPMLDTNQQDKKIPPILDSKDNNDGAQTEGKREDVASAARQKDDSGNSPSSGESSHLFSDRDLMSVLGHPDEYRRGKPDKKR